VVKKAKSIISLLHVTMVRVAMLRATMLSVTMLCVLIVIITLTACNIIGGNNFGNNQFNDYDQFSEYDQFGEYDQDSDYTRDREFNQINEFNASLVDERFELIALVFRLAGISPFADDFTDYQRLLDDAFSGFGEHPAVAFARSTLRFHEHHAVLWLAIHLRKEEGIFVIGDSESLYNDPRWRQGRGTSFVDFLNDFYRESNFATFFQDQTEYFVEHSGQFGYEILSHINIEWFRQYNLNPGNMHVILSPSLSRDFSAGWVDSEYLDEKIVYALVPASANYPIGWYLPNIINGFVRAFTNSLADVWLAENSEFSRWVHDSMDFRRMPFFPSVDIMAREYVARTHVILYMVENTEADLRSQLFSAYIFGLRYIQEVYALITSHEMLDFPAIDMAVLGIGEYRLYEEQTFEIGDRIITWQFLDLLGHEIELDDLITTRVDMLFDSQTGQVMYVSIDSMKYLFVDIGCGTDEGWFEGIRRYFVLPITD